MDNQTIIAQESLKLMREGIIRGSGTVGTIVLPHTIYRGELPIAIHTFAAWKARGYSVKRGEHAIAKIMIWKYATRRDDQEEEDADGEHEDAGRMFRKLSYFFSADQVEKLQAAM